MTRLSKTISVQLHVLSKELGKKVVVKKKPSK